MMEGYNGSTLTSNVLAFGVLTLCFVVLRLSFRLYTRKTSASDWVLALALVSLILFFTSSEEQAREDSRIFGIIILMVLIQS